MWLIDASTLSLKPFYGGDIPNYAILSHTWGDDEVSFQEFAEVDKTQNAGITSKAGYHKIVATCEHALQDGHSYVWIDTCCVNKASSAELTEAINSMFGWYQHSQICYVFLSDFELNIPDISSLPIEFNAAFRQCRWFTRGWCLQELLAPRHVRFLSRKWQTVGTKSLLGRLISNITGIPEAVLSTPPRKEIWDCPIADRISWIAKRQTTRIEDMSYSLLGILEVNMPMLYGEGPAAFTRLQGEVIRKHNDLSIFSWAGEATPSGFLPVLAATPSSFIGQSTTNYSRVSLGNILNTQFSLTNQGVFFPNAKLQYQNAVPGYRHQYLLDLSYMSRRSHRRYLPLQKVGPGLFIRLCDSTERQKAFRKMFVTPPFDEDVCILHNLTNPILRQLSLWERYAVRLRWKPWEKAGQRFWHIRTAEPRSSWDLAANQFLLETTPVPYLYVEFVPGNYETNPDLKYFVLEIQVGNEQSRNPAIMSIRIISAETWLGLNRTLLGWRGRGKVLHTAQTAESSSRISLVGYDILMSVQLVTEKSRLPYHHVYLDWKVAATEEKTSACKTVLS